MNIKFTDIKQSLDVCTICRYWKFKKHKQLIQQIILESKPKINIEGEYFSYTLLHSQPQSDPSNTAQTEVHLCPRCSCDISLKYFFFKNQLDIA